MKGAVVLGMHRSGTSAVTRVLNLLGAALPPEGDLLTNFDNPDGHWESRTLVACNDRILDGFGRSWDFPPWPAPGWEASPWASSMMGELAEAFSSVYPAGPWVWKDPRTCLTFPLWRRVLGGDLCTVLVFRSPTSVTGSLRRRDGIPRVYGAGLWLAYLAATLQAARGLPAVCVDFDALRADPLSATTRLADDLAALGLALGGDVAGAAGSVHVHDAVDAPADGAEWLDQEVDRLTGRAEALVRGLAPRAESFSPPPFRAPAWVRPLLFAYRGPWALRSRLGHPLRPRAA